ncbi:prepilin peptidase [Demequina zhanjiangensis]|uniref:Prepilin peptidase n=1 Tax=Demequina zhanjiangensis TaxID=3051659 RepID=A0ABT8G2H8_9MICO|nr:A24 family peptidase [Demequina sp. SYSU T00b26]MDN4473351.1 prepilin peptidase [Demequina sp. SYSU T00b26]
MTGSTALLALLAGLIGLALGSFANVLIHRVPSGASIVSPPSACPACGARIRARHNVPVVGWLVLRGRCADCGEPISPRYPIIEGLVGVLFAGIVAVGGLTVGTALALGLAYFGVVLSAIDLETRRLPNPLTGAFAIYVGAVILVGAAATGDWGAALRALIGAAVLGLLYFLAFFLYPKGMGFGDVKLAPTLGALLAWFGWDVLAVGGFAAFVWGAAFGIVSMIASRRSHGVTIPFGPWMFAGAVTGLVVGGAVASWYLGLVGLDIA